VPNRQYYEALTEEVVRQLQKERKRRKLSNYAVSKRSGVPESTLSRIERGLCNPSLELILRVADAVGADLPRIIKSAQRQVVCSKSNPDKR
jgi:transcriptional regulator with XRE-family HTH domain